MTDDEIIEIAAGYSEQDNSSTVSFYPSNLLKFARAIEAARATAEQSTFALQALVAAGHVSQAKVDEALSIAGKTPGIRAAEQNQSDAWKEYAQHLEHCRQCGEMSYTDCDEGTRLHDDANSIESQQDAAIESKPAEQRAWYPIETARKDREIWAFNGEQARMKWSEGTDWALWIWADELMSEVDPEPDQPTHWRPLPKPPADAAIDSQRSGDGS